MGTVSWTACALVFAAGGLASLLADDTAARPPSGPSLPDFVDAPATLTVGPSGGVPRVVIFSDYECAACAVLEREIGPRLRTWAELGRLRIELRHAPLAAHRRARHAASWTVCAARGGQGWALHERLLASLQWRGPGPSGAAFAALADSIGLDGAAVETCLRSADVTDALAADRALAAAVDLRAVPAVYLDGRPVHARSPRSLLREIRRALADPDAARQ